MLDIIRFLLSLGLLYILLYFAIIGGFIALLVYIVKSIFKD